MILPSKHLSEGRALITVGAAVLQLLNSPRSASEVWEELRSAHVGDERNALSFDWFTLALTFLYSIEAIDLRSDGQLELAVSARNRAQ